MAKWKDYLDNIKRCREFYNSDFYQYLTLEKLDYVEKVIHGLMDDPDIFDKELYNCAAEYYTNNEHTYEVIISRNRPSLIHSKTKDISLGLDCICSWKSLYKFHDKKEEWIEDYETIRSNIKSHLIFPRHPDNINTLRGRRLKDRIDLTLFDLKKFYEVSKDKSDEEFRDYLGKLDNKDNELIFLKAYLNNATFLWLRSFSSFIDYCEKNKLKNYLIINGKSIEVRDLNANKLTVKRLKPSVLTTIPNDRTPNKNYYSNLKSILEMS